MPDHSRVSDILNYAPSQHQPKGWRRGDWWLLAAVLVYGATNLVMALLDCFRVVPGMGRHGVPELMLGVSVLGAIVTFPIQFLLRRRGVTWRSAVIAVVLFLGLVGLDFWWFIGNVLSSIG